MRTLLDNLSDNLNLNELFIQDLKEFVSKATNNNISGIHKYLFLEKNKPNKYIFYNTIEFEFNEFIKDYNYIVKDNEMRFAIEHLGFGFHDTLHYQRVWLKISESQNSKFGPSGLVMFYFTESEFPIKKIPLHLFLSVELEPLV